MATQIAAPTITELMIDALSLMPLLIRMRIVTAIRVIPDNGDQLVLPRHSETMTPGGR